jgi:hypothetical protein
LRISGEPGAARNAALPSSTPAAGTSASHAAAAQAPAADSALPQEAFAFFAQNPRLAPVVASPTMEMAAAVQAVSSLKARINTIDDTIKTFVNLNMKNGAAKFELTAEGRKATDSLYCKGLFSSSRDEALRLATSDSPAGKLLAEKKELT